MLADISFFNSLSPNMQAGYNLGDRDFSEFDNPEKMSESVRKGGLFLGELFDRFGVPIGDSFKDMVFKKATKEQEKSIAGSCSVNPSFGGPDKIITLAEPTDYSTETHKGMWDNPRDMYDFHTYFFNTIVHELIHAVSHLPANEYLNPYRDQISSAEIAFMGKNNPYALTEYAHQPDNLLEYSSTLLNHPNTNQSTLTRWWQSLTNQPSNSHYNNVTRYWRKNAQLTTDEVVNQPYSTIRQYLKTNPNPNERTKSAQQLSDQLISTCKYASLLSNYATKLLRHINNYSDYLKQDDMQQVPVVRDMSSSLYGDDASSYSFFWSEDPTTGLYAGRNIDYVNAKKALAHRPYTPLTEEDAEDGLWGLDDMKNFDNNLTNNR